MATPAKAIEAGEQLLAQFSREKSRPSGSDEEDPTPFDAIAEGSNLAYSAEKRKQLNFDTPTSTPGNTPEDPQNEALGAIRSVLFELTDMENGENEDLLDRIPKLTKLLQGAEVHLESSVSRPNKRLFSTPGTTSATPLGKDVLKVYMGNQLDLQESELANYEEMIENLVQQLEEAQREKDEVSEILERLRLENTDLKQQLTESENRVSLQSQQYSISSEQYASLQSDFDALRGEYEEAVSTLSSNQDKLSSLQHQCQTLEEELSVATTSARDAEVKYATLEEELRETKERMEDTEVELDKMALLLEEKNITIQSLQKSSDSSEQSLSHELSTLKQRLQEAENTITDKNAFISHMNSILDSNDTTKSPKHVSPSHKARELGLSDEEIFLTMEKKIKVQVSNLQYLQDTLSEEKQRSAILHDQKQSLKEEVSRLKQQYATLEGEYSDMRMRNHTLSQAESHLNAALINANEQLQALQAQYNDISNQLTTSSTLAQSLQTQNSDLRKQLEDTGNQLALLTSVSTATAPSAGAKVNAKIDKLQARVRALEQETSELKLFQTANEEKLVYKQKRVDDLSNENMKLRQQCLTLREDIEQARLLQLKKEAELEGVVVEKERTVESLRVMVENLEEELHDCREKLSAERDTVYTLQELLMQLSEKDAVNEELLSETRAQLESTRRDMSVVELEEKKKILESLQAEHSSLEQSYSAIQSQNIAYVKTIDSMQQQVALLEMKVKSSSADDIKRALKHISDDIIYSTGDMATVYSKLQEHVTRTIDEYNNRMDNIYINSQHLVFAITRRLDEKQQIIDELQVGKNALMDAKAGLESTVSDYERDIAQLQHQVSSLKQEHGALTSQLQLSTVQFDEKSGIIEEDIRSISERLSLTEKKATELSAQNAKDFAKYTKQISRLSSENVNLKNVIDHLRLVNTKLLCDVRSHSSSSYDAASFQQDLLESISKLEQKVASLENDLAQRKQEMRQVMEQHELAELEREKQFDAELQIEISRYRELQDKLSARNKEVSSLEHCLQQERSQFAAKEESYQYAVKAAEKQRESDAKHAEEQAAAIHALETAAVSMQSNYDHIAHSYEDLQSKYASLKSQLDETLHQLQQSDRSHDSVLQEYKHKLDKAQSDLLARESGAAALKRELTEMKETLEDSTRAKSTLETQVQKLNKQRVLDESKIADLSKYLEETRQQLSDADTEVRNASHKVSKLEDANRKLVTAKESVESALAEVQQELSLITSAHTTLMTEHASSSAALTNEQQANATLNIMISNLKNEVANLKQQLASANTEISLKTSEIDSFQQIIAESEEVMQLKTKRIMELESQISTKNSDYDAILQVENAILTDITSAISTLHVADAGKSDTGVALLRTPTKSSVTPYRSPKGHQQSPLSRLQSQMSQLMQSISDHIEWNNALYDQKMQQTKLANDYRHHVERLEAETVQLQQDLQSVFLQAKGSDEEVQMLNNEIIAIGNEKEKLLKMNNDYEQLLQLIKRQLDITGAESVRSIEILRKLHIEHSEEHAHAMVVHHKHPVLSNVAEYVSGVARVHAALHQLYSNFTIKEQSLSRLEKNYNELLQSKQTDTSALQAQVKSLQAKLSTETGVVQRLKADVKSLEMELETCSVTMSELTNSNLQYEQQCKQQQEALNELKSALQDGESVIHELRDRIQSLLTEVTTLQDEVDRSGTEISQHKQRINQLELQLDQANAHNGRLKAERDSYVAQRSQHEQDIARLKSELCRCAPTDDGEKYNFESENLIRYLIVTLEQMNSTFEIFTESTDEAPRVDALIKKLSQIRHWCRADKRSQRYAEDQLARLQFDYKSLQEKYESEKRELQAVLAEYNKREKTLTENITTLANSSTSAKGATQNAAIEMWEIKYNNLNSRRAEEVKQLQSEIEEHKERYATLLESSNQWKIKYEKTSSEAHSRDLQISQLKFQLNQYEDAIEDRDRQIDKLKRDAMETVRNLEELRDSLSQELEQARDNQTELETRLNVEKRNYLLESQRYEELIRQSRTEQSSSESKILSLEKKLSQYGKTEVSLKEQIAQLKQDCLSLQIRFDTASTGMVDRERSLGETQSVLGDLQQQVSQKEMAAREASEKCIRLEQTVKQLKDQVVTLSTALESTTAAYHAEQDKHHKHEAEMQKQAIMLEKANRELAVTQSRATTLRHQGKHAKQEISTATASIKKLISNLRSVHGSTVGATTTRYNEDEDALGIMELSAQISLLTTHVNLVSSSVRQPLNLEVSLKRTESENQRIMRELEVIEASYNDKVKRLQNEVTYLEGQLTKYRSSNATAISFLQPRPDTDALLAEKEREIAVLKEELAKQHDALLNATAERARSMSLDSRNSKEHESRILTRENSLNESTQREVISLRQELATVRGHIAILQETVSQLENMQLEYHGNNEYRKYSALQHMINIYHHIICQHIPDIAYVCNETMLMKSSYDDEVKALTSANMRNASALQQSEAYCAELRTRLEESLRVLHRNLPPSDTASALSAQLSQLSTDLQHAQQKVKQLTHDLHSCRHHSNSKHTSLMNELVASYQSRDAAIVKARRLEAELRGKSTDKDTEKQELVNQIVSLENTLSELRSSSASGQERLSEQERVIKRLQASLVECDNELDTYKKHYRRRYRDDVPPASVLPEEKDTPPPKVSKLTKRTERESQLRKPTATSSASKRMETTSTAKVRTAKAADTKFDDLTEMIDKITTPKKSQAATPPQRRAARKHVEH